MTRPMTADEQAEARGVLANVGNSAPAVATAVCRALQPIIPTGWRGHIEVVVDDGCLRPENVSIKMRPRQQPKEGRT